MKDRSYRGRLKFEPPINLGSVYETAVACELKAHGHDLFYYDNSKKGEVDFLVNDYDSLSIVPRYWERRHFRPDEGRHL